MMWCVCIGGPCAANRVQVHEGLAIDYPFAVPYRKPLSIKDMIGADAQQMVADERPVYLVTVLAFSGSTMRLTLLRDPDMTPTEAMDRVCDVLAELTNMRYPDDWTRWSPDMMERALNMYAEIGDPYAPN